ncbi:hypothetical protein AB9T88_16190, partial [Flavobacterium sp. LBUM151]
IKQIAEALCLNLTSLRWFPIVPLLPNTDCDLFQLFDIVPREGFIANVDNQSPLFSTTYGKIAPHWVSNIRSQKWNVHLCRTKYNSAF